MRLVKNSTGALENNDFLCLASERPPLLNCKEVTAVCKKISKVSYRPFHQTKWVFQFEVFEPQQYQGLSLSMYVRIDPAWGKPPIHSKLSRACTVASKGRPKVREITKRMFVGRLFRCFLRTVGQDDARYSIIDTIVEALTGGGNAL